MSPSHMKRLRVFESLELWLWESRVRWCYNIAQLLLEVLHSTLPRWQTFSWLLPDKATTVRGWHVVTWCFHVLATSTSMNAKQSQALCRELKPEQAFNGQLRRSFHGWENTSDQIQFTMAWAKSSSLRMIQESRSCRYLSLPAPGAWIQLQFRVLLTRPMMPH